MISEFTMEHFDTVVVGGGQAGIAMSEHLSNAGVAHVVLERHRIAERWRSQRWDSLVANGPAWHDRFPGMEFPETHPDAFPGKEAIADYFVAYANMIDAPIRCGVAVTSVCALEGRPGFRLETTAGTLEANSVVAATGAFQTPVVPDLVPATPDIVQMHSSAYKNPEQLPAGAVLVVGAGSSGGQIADELLRAGRKTYLSVGAHDRPPRRYRGRDFVWWLGVLRKWDAEVAGADHVTISVSGANGGRTVDFREFATRGMQLVGVTEGYDDGVVCFADNLVANIQRGDANYLSVLKEADRYVARNGLDLPEEPEAHRLAPLPPSVTEAPLQLDLTAANIRSIVWATGYVNDFSWLKVPAFDDAGKPLHQRGIAREPGIYFLGLSWQTRRASSFIWGVWHDAKFVADHIATQKKYHTYESGQ
tara:strand:+ start:578 stop:1837 length:1260 start_codon:yes stop_codon:yes gene_type:complete